MDTLVSNQVTFGYSSDLSILSYFQINVMHITPAFVHWMATEAMVDDYKAPHLRSVLCAGAPIDSNLANTMKCRLNIKDFRQCI